MEELPLLALFAVVVFALDDDPDEELFLSDAGAIMGPWPWLRSANEYATNVITTPIARKDFLTNNPVLDITFHNI